MKVRIPEKLSEIKLKNYQKYLSIAEDNEDAEEFLSLKMIELFCDVPFNKVRQMKLKDVQEITQTLDKAFESKRQFKTKFEINGQKFGFMPDAENMTMGEYIDINTYLGEVKDLHKLMAVMYRPITVEKKDLYDIEEYEGSEKYSTMMLDAPLDVALEAQVFFYHLANDLLHVTAGYLEVAEMKRRAASRNRGAGIKVFTRWLMGKSSNLKRSRS